MKERWKDVVGFEGIYEVSNLGTIRRLKNKRVLKPTRTKYQFVHLTKNKKAKICLIHRVVAMAFIPNPENLPEINHKDCDTHNNVATNLEWCDRKYNINYGDRTRKAMKKVCKPILCIEKNIVYKSLKEAAEKNGLQKSKLSNVCHGKRKTTGGYHWRFV